MDDLISRAEAIVRTSKVIKDDMVAHDVKEALKHLPTAEPKRGKWLPENRTIDAFWVCSSCGFPSEAHAANILYKYCPNCGAEMEVPNGND